MDVTSELRNPEFLHCEFPIKTGDIVRDNRAFIYCVNYLSLIEIIPMDLFLAAFPIEQAQKEYTYETGETFLLVFTQNNIELANEATGKDTTPEQLLDLAWNYYREYLIWEDSQI